MDSDNGINSQIYLSDDSDELDLQTVSHRLSQAAASSAPLKDPDEDPDWVKEFSVAAATEEDKPRKRRRTSTLLKVKEDEDEEILVASSNDDDDSIIDVASDRDEENDQTQSQSQIRSESDEKKKTKKGKEEDKEEGKGKSALKSSLPLVVGAKLEESLTLLQGSGEGDELDLSGDVGAVGRVKVAPDGEVLVDMKGSVFLAQGYACGTVAVVSVGEDEARVSAVLDEAVLLRHERNLFESATVLRGHVSDGDDDDDDDGEAAADVFKMAGEEASDVKTPKKAGKATTPAKSAKASKASKGGRSKAGIKTTKAKAK